LAQSFTLGVRRQRPFCLLRFNTFLPPGVLMRARKPWVLARFLRLGCQVLFIHFPPWGLGPQYLKECSIRRAIQGLTVFYTLAGER